VLLDDLQGRRLAMRWGLPVLGVGGLLLLAKEKGAVENVEPWITKLRGQGYRLSKALVLELMRRR
jgi:predicted nucleic acid-binding protein